VQLYGGDIFSSVRTELETIFKKLPGPKPSYQRGTPLESMKRYYPSYNHAKNFYPPGFEVNNVYSLSNTSSPLNSSVNVPSTSDSSSNSSSSDSSSASDEWVYSYNASSSGCIAGNCLVQMADGTFKQVDGLIAGDKVKADSSGTIDEVICVLKTICNENRIKLVTLPGGLRITPYHPILMDKWVFPADLASTEVTTCPAVYNFVLKKHHSIIIEGMQCVTLGHGLEGEVVGHPYFGTQLIINDLKQLKGWKSGLIVISPNPNSRDIFVRDVTSGLVCGLVGIEQ